MKNKCLMEIILFFLLVTFTFLSPTTAKIYGNETDMLSLLEFKSQLTEESSAALSSWNRTNHYCDWIGVSCSNNRKYHPPRVISLELSFLSLAGCISPSLANLTFLTNLNLSNNGLSGTIPPEFGIMQKLWSIDLSFNSLQGEIPIKLSNCSDLIVLVLDGNALSGRIPEEIGLLSELVYLSFGNNSLTGGIPTSLGNLSSLIEFFAVSNHLEGSIPYEIGSLHRLLNFQVSCNNLSGMIPSSIFNISSLSSFVVEFNQLAGRLPPTMGLTLPKLENILFGNNQFEGPIPHSLPNASKLSYLDMSSNFFNENVPPNLGMLDSLSHLMLDDNLLGAGYLNSLEFLSSLANCSQLMSVSVTSNSLSGELPNSISNFSTNLQFLGLNGNMIFGNVPSEIGNLFNLNVLGLAQNHLTGAIPTSIGKLKILQALLLFENNLVGNIPSSLGNQTNLIYLYLHRNGLDGMLPPGLGNLQKLNELTLSGNQFSGTITKEIFRLSSLRILRLSDNSLVGLIPSQVMNMTNLYQLSIAGNKLTGEIPSALGNCQFLQFLNISQNLLNGSIPKSFSNLKELQTLDLSRNNLSGAIPDFLESLSLTYLNLSFNKFEGEAPRKGIFQNTTATSLLGNDGICGGVPGYHLPPCHTKSTERRGISLVFKVVISTSSIFIGLLASLLYIYLKTKPKQEKLTSPSSEDQYLRVSYIELAKATNGFSQANLIGTGSYGFVYKGTMDDGNTIIAVKVFNLEEQGASKSFVDEYEALRHIRHRNLIKILTSCSSIDSQGNDFKALVFECMPNGNLDEWLHAEKSVGLVQRLNIAIDVAEAINYMHHDCETPIIHRDLKPSNILLDNDMVAHVGDFGLAKPLQDSSCSVGIRGTIGYVAPEYGSGGKMSTSGDVYSYGILLLEMFTGRRPIDDMFKDGHNLNEFVQMAFPDRVMDIIDPSLVLQNEGGELIDQVEMRLTSRRGIQECVTSVVKVGLSCSKESPEERTDMRAVAMELHGIRDTLLIGHRAQSGWGG